MPLDVPKHDVPHAAHHEQTVSSEHAGYNRMDGRQLRSRIAREVRCRVDRALSSVSSPPGTRAAKVERRLKASLTPAWEKLKERPAVGVVAAGGLGFVAAEVIGVSEILLAIGFAYVAYDVLKKGLPLSEAVDDAEHLIQP